MKKIRSFEEITEELIRGWSTPQVEEFLASSGAEQHLLVAYENGLYETPNDPKLGPREMIFVLSTKRDLSPAFIREVKAMTRHWIDKTAASWSDNVPPFYSVEMDYILHQF
jgi:hypothetical protein